MLIFGLMKQSLQITLIQSHLFWEDIDANLSHFEELISNISETLMKLGFSFSITQERGDIEISQSVKL